MAHKNKPLTEAALTETLGKSLGYQFKNAEEWYDRDYDAYMAHRTAWNEMMYEVETHTKMMSEMYNLPTAQLRPIVLDLPHDLPLQDLSNLVSVKLNRKPINVRLFMEGRQDWWYQEAGQNSASIIAKATQSGISVSEYLYSYGAGWEFSCRTNPTVKPKARDHASLN